MEGGFSQRQSHIKYTHGLLLAADHLSDQKQTYMTLKNQLVN